MISPSPVKYACTRLRSASLTQRRCWMLSWIITNVIRRTKQSAITPNTASRCSRTSATKPASSMRTATRRAIRIRGLSEDHTVRDQRKSAVSVTVPDVSQSYRLNRSPVDIRISKETDVPLRQQIAAQIEYQIAIGKLKPGEPLPSVRALARQLKIHHNTVSQAYQDVTFLQLLSRKHGSRLVVRTPEERVMASHPDLDDLINQTIRVARRHGYTIQELSQRVRERLSEEPLDHILLLSIDPGMSQML